MLVSMQRYGKFLIFVNYEKVKYMERLFGLIGYPLSHSFSKRYFTEKFEREGIAGCRYELFPLERIEDLLTILEENPSLCGLNVTIPYKQTVIPYLHQLDAGAQAIGAVNTIRIADGKLTGYNTDAYGFMESLQRFLQQSGHQPPGALVFGTGGAAKAVVWALQQLGIPHLSVSRRAEAGSILYESIDKEHFTTHPLLINTTPLGMSPHTDACPPLPYDLLDRQNLLYDLVYNPEETLFLQKGKEAGCHTTNGLEMLYLQAEKAWSVWNDPAL